MTKSTPTVLLFRTQEWASYAEARIIEIIEILWVNHGFVIGRKIHEIWIPKHWSSTQACFKHTVSLFLKWVIIIDTSIYIWARNWIPS